MSEPTSREEEVAALSDDELVEYLEFYQQLRKDLQLRGDGWGAWYCTIFMSAALVEQRRRS